VSEVFFYKKIINPMVFQSMVREEDIKNHFKDQLAHELAKQLIASKRTTFTYSRDHFGDQYILKAEIKL